MLLSSRIRGPLVAIFFALAGCGGSDTGGSSSAGSSSAPDVSNAAVANGSTQVALSAASYSVPVSATTATITVTRQGDSQGAAAVSYATANGTAAAGSDYSPTSGTLNWADGESDAKTIAVPVTAAGVNKTFSVKLVAVAGAASFGSPTAATVSLTPSGNGKLSIAVSGNRFVDGNGNAVQLRGANISGLEGGIIFGGGNSFWSSSGFGSRPDFTKLAGWKLNAVRLPLNEDSWLGVSVLGAIGNLIGLNGQAYQDEVAASVAAANAAGLYVILDLHWTAPSYFAANAQNPMADEANSASFWTSVASAFKDNPAVIFELFNEPYVDPLSQSDGAFAAAKGGIPDSAANLILRDGGTASYYFGSNNGKNGGSKLKMAFSWKVAGYQTLIDAIRATGATNVILAGGNHYSNDLSWWGQVPPVDPISQLGAAIHLYAGGYPNNFANGSSSTDKMVAADVANYPLVVTEFGDEVGSAPASYTQQMTAWLDLHDYSVTAWTWNPWGGNNTLIQNAQSYAPTVGFGQAYHDWTANHD